MQATFKRRNNMRFRGEYWLLSNFYNCSIEYEGKIYPSVENAFQASKVLDEDEREIFTKCTPVEAKRLGRKVKLRDDWEEVKVLIMTGLIFTKFIGSREEFYEVPFMIRRENRL